MSDVIQVFEHSTLPVGGPITPARFDRLVQYNERHGSRFFDVGHKRIHFRNYVGVIQVGNLTIEILPKADTGVFAKAEPPSNVLDHSCSMLFIELFIGDRLDPDLGVRLIKQITSPS